MISVTQETTASAPANFVSSLPHFSARQFTQLVVEEGEQDCGDEKCGQDESQVAQQLVSGGELPDRDGRALGLVEDSGEVVRNERDEERVEPAKFSA